VARGNRRIGAGSCGHPGRDRRRDNGKRREPHRLVQRRQRWTTPGNDRRPDDAARCGRRRALRRESGVRPPHRCGDCDLSGALLWGRPVERSSVHRRLREAGADLHLFDPFPSQCLSRRIGPRQLTGRAHYCLGASYRNPSASSHEKGSVRGSRGIAASRFQWWTESPSANATALSGSHERPPMPDTSSVSIRAHTPRASCHKSKSCRL
jgi:hypothetical protein